MKPFDIGFAHFEPRVPSCSIISAGTATNHQRGEPPGDDSIVLSLIPSGCNFGSNVWCHDRTKRQWVSVIPFHCS